MKLEFASGVGNAAVRDADESHLEIRVPRFGSNKEVKMQFERNRLTKRPCWHGDVLDEIEEGEVLHCLVE